MAPTSRPAAGSAASATPPPSRAGTWSPAPPSSSRSFRMAYPHARSARGAALLIAMVLMAILAVVALALVRRTNNEMDAVGGKRNYDRSVSCAEAGRQMLLSQFRVFGMDPTSIVLNTHAGNLNVYTGHYDQFAIQTGQAGSQRAGPGADRAPPPPAQPHR